jgi:hypothetical protein
MISLQSLKWVEKWWSLSHESPKTKTRDDWMPPRFPSFIPEDPNESTPIAFFTVYLVALPPRTHHFSFNLMVRRGSDRFFENDPCA